MDKLVASLVHAYYSIIVYPIMLCQVHVITLIWLKNAYFLINYYIFNDNIIMVVMFNKTVYGIDLLCKCVKVQISKNLFYMVPNPLLLTLPARSSAGWPTLLNGRPAARGQAQPGAPEDH